MTMLGLVDALLELVEPFGSPGPTPDQDFGASGTKRDRTAAEPFVFDTRPDTVFAFESEDRRDTFGTTANGQGEDMVRFVIEVVYVADSGMEEPQEMRTRSVSEKIDAKRQQYVEAVRRVRSGADWSHLQASVDVDFIRAYSVRGFALRLTGWRHES
jgi:hypothetical protein